MEWPFAHLASSQSARSILRFLGPNLSITGSLATILWLQAIRRESEDVGFWPFLKGGCVTMTPALAAALGTRLVIG